MDKQQDMPTYVCRAKAQVAGREEPSLGSPLFRKRDGSLSLLDVDEIGYHSADEPPPWGDWIDLWAIPGGHFAHFLGYFEASDFEIEGRTD